MLDDALVSGWCNQEVSGDAIVYSDRVNRLLEMVQEKDEGMWRTGDCVAAQTIVFTLHVRLISAQERQLHTYIKRFPSMSMDKMKFEQCAREKNIQCANHSQLHLNQRRRTAGWSQVG